LNIVFLSSSDPLDVHSFSGTVYYMARALKAEFPDMEIVRRSRPMWFEPLQRIILRVCKGRVDPYYWDILNRWFARRLLRRWQGRRVVVLSVVNAALVAELAAAIPVINVSDATFDLVRTKYDFLLALGDHAAASAEADELRSIRNAVHNSFSSKWAANSAIKHYGAVPKYVSVTSWGCNLEYVPKTEIRPNSLERVECRLLFIGGEWIRKGGDVVCAAAEILISRGLPMRVDVVGVSPPENLQSLPWLNHHGYLSKADNDDAALLRSLMRDAFFLFLPTRSDCTPMVFAEANAYGTPVLTRDVGGVADVVRDGDNGVVLPEDADAVQFAAIIESLWRKRDHYSRLRASARSEYESRLNWSSWARAIAEKIERLSAEGQI
jgi:glycosyltransferase involved in cell wall biosynthesis